MAQLRSVTWKNPREGTDGFPFTVPAIASLTTLDLDASVTFFVGENGSGKSTLLEALAAAARLPAVSSVDLAQDPTLEAQRRLGESLRLAWSRRITRGFFLRAEDFFGYARRLARERAELERSLRETETEYAVEYSRRLAQGPLRASLSDMERRYGRDLDANSHGESFLRLFGSRIVPAGLHLLDEPEAALSPQSQLGLIAMMMDAVDHGAQFIIATHSPILLAFPEARILSFDETPVRPVPFDQVGHVRLTREFLEAPERYLRRLADTG